MYKMYARRKDLEIEEVNLELEETKMKHSLEERDTLAYQLKKEVSILHGQIKNLSSKLFEKEKETNVHKAQKLNTEEDNFFLRNQLKEVMGENASIKSTLSNIYSEIEDSKLLSKELHLPTNTQDVVNLMTRVSERISKMLKEKHTLTSMLESEIHSVLEKGKGRSKSPLMRNVDFSHKHRKGFVTPIGKSTKSILSLPQKEGETKNTPRIDSEQYYKKQFEILKRRCSVLQNELRSSQFKNYLLASKKNEIEDVFINSFEEAKKLIFQRRLKIDTGNTYYSKATDPHLKSAITQNVALTLKKLHVSAISQPAVKSITLSNFTLEDKLNLVTMFVCNEKILFHFYRLVFPNAATSCLGEVPNDNKEKMKTLDDLNVSDDEKTSHPQGPTEQTSKKFSRLAALTPSRSRTMLQTQHISRNKRMLTYSKTKTEN
eukprot:TRINITY_DN4308_c0_g1_i1.p1 TRINITY_DN4308_c0_g1~~TRINITY_DN4308_c0_g1_i1.p1  ORF type:complete len:432 (-),score=72.42 TRINITY_DN4308_c0_g1_i1:13-1308(-)